MATFSLKLDFNGDVRKRTVPLDLQFDALEATVRDIYGFSAGEVLQFKYTDEDNDIVTLANHDDLREALANLKRDANFLRSLRLSVLKNASPAVAVSLPETAQPSPAVQPTEAHIAEPAEAKGFFELIKQVAKEANFDIDDVLQAYREQGVHAAIPKFQAAVLRAQLTPLQLAPMYYKVASGMHLSEFRDIMANLEGGLPAMLKTFGIPMQSAFAAGPSKQVDSAVPPPTAPAADNSKPENTALVKHYNVQCDGCDKSPIEGARYKSLEKEDYDLCQACFDKEDRKGEYVCIARPGDRAWLNAMRGRHGGRGGWGRGGHHPFMPYPAPDASGPAQPASQGSGRMHPAGPWAPHGRCKWPRFAAGKPDARFVSDVTIFDGTEVLPGQKFTKIWKIKNSGSCPWPPSTHLVHVGGDVMSVDSVPVPVPEGGLLPDQDLDVSVDMVAPGEPGRYVSHWRLAWANNGPKFGHRLWALVQVVPSTEEPVKTAEDASLATVVGECAVGRDVAPADTVMQGAPAVQMPVALTAIEASAVGVGNTVEVPVAWIATEPVAISWATGPSATIVEGIGSNEVVVEDIAAQPAVTKSQPVEVQPVAQQVVQEDLQEQDMLEKVDQMQKHVADIDIASASAAALPSAQDLAESGVLVPDVRDEEKDWQEVNVETWQDERQPAQEGDMDVHMYAQQERQLVDMGFTDVTLNREILHATEGDLETSVARLVAVTGWDNHLLELNDMGFFDKELNMRLMVKNNGSIARTVKELVELSMSGTGSVMVLD
eukprot:jgi/Chlat1/5681/Chrsp37S05486